MRRVTQTRGRDMEGNEGCIAYTLNKGNPIRPITSQIPTTYQKSSKYILNKYSIKSTHEFIQILNSKNTLSKLSQPMMQKLNHLN